MGMSRHDAYYEPEDDYDNSDEFDYEVSQLMKPGAEYDYRTTQAIAEAMGDLDKDRADALQAMIDTNDYEKIGRKVMMMALDYMERFAKDAAETELND
jgi:hypothetical protein